MTNVQQLVEAAQQNLQGRKDFKHSVCLLADAAEAWLLEANTQVVHNHTLLLSGHT